MSLRQTLHGICAGARVASTGKTVIEKSPLKGRNLYCQFTRHAYTFPDDSGKTSF
jgi:hypothetical protein